MLLTLLSMLQDTASPAASAGAASPAASAGTASIELDSTAPAQRLWNSGNSQHSDAEKLDGWGRSPLLGAGWKLISDASAVTEVHLRRLDSSDTLHRRVVAVLTVDGTPEEVSLLAKQWIIQPCCISRHNVMHSESAY